MNPKITEVHISADRTSLFFKLELEDKSSIHTTMKFVRTQAGWEFINFVNKSKKVPKDSDILYQNNSNVLMRNKVDYE